MRRSLKELELLSLSENGTKLFNYTSVFLVIICVILSTQFATTTAKYHGRRMRFVWKVNRIKSHLKFWNQKVCLGKRQLFVRK
jgi:hypothetical protein